VEAFLLETERDTAHITHLAASAAVAKESSVAASIDITGRDPCTYIRHYITFHDVTLH
jgi:hypothetical protein